MISNQKVPERVLNEGKLNFTFSLFKVKKKS